jgi:hypothetical protein
MELAFQQPLFQNLLPSQNYGARFTRNAVKTDIIDLEKKSLL